MTQPLTPERLAEMRARCEAATPGPWIVESSNHLRASSGDVVAEFAYEDPDAEFIAHARTDLPALLDELERVTRERDEARAEVASLRSQHTVNDLPVDETPKPPPADPRLLALANAHLVDRVRELDAEVERLRAEHTVNDLIERWHCLEGDAVPLHEYLGLTPAQYAGVVEGRAHPRVHPLAWEFLQSHKMVTVEDYLSHDQAVMYVDYKEAWEEEGCPLLAEGDADTPVVPAGEET